MMPPFVHCNTCQVIQPAELEPLEFPDISGEYLGGDLLYGVCHQVIATFYRSKPKLSA